MRPLAYWVECSPMVQETKVQSQVKSYQRLKKWYLMWPCLALRIIRYRSRVKWTNPENGVAPSLHLGVVAIEKGASESPSTKVTNFTFIYTYKILLIKIFIYRQLSPRWLVVKILNQEYNMSRTQYFYHH